MKIEIPDNIENMTINLNPEVLDFKTMLVEGHFWAIILIKGIALLLHFLLKTNIVNPEKRLDIIKIIPILNILSNIILFSCMTLYLEKWYIGIFIMVYTIMFVIRFVKALVRSD